MNASFLVLKRNGNRCHSPCVEGERKTKGGSRKSRLEGGGLHYRSLQAFPGFANPLGIQENPYPPKQDKGWHYPRLASEKMNTAVTNQ